MEPQTGTDGQNQPSAPNYDFIMNSEKQAKRKLPGLPGPLGSSPFIVKIALIVSGAVALMIVMAIAVSLLFSGGTNIDSAVSLTQTQQEIARIGDFGKDSAIQKVKNASVSVRLTVKSHQQDWLAFLQENGRQVKTDELNAKRDLSVDSSFQTAKETSTFEPTYATLMLSRLENYSTELRTAYDNTDSKQQRELLNQHYADAQALLTQWSQ